MFKITTMSTLRNFEVMSDNFNVTEAILVDIFHIREAVHCMIFI